MNSALPRQTVKGVIRSNLLILSNWLRQSGLWARTRRLTVQANHYGMMGVLIVLLTACASPNAEQKQTNIPPPLPKEAMPYFWPDPSVPEPKWPQAHPDAVYREGMTPRQYFEHLCKLEAGEFIYKTVQDVESIYFVRLQGRPKPSVARYPDVIEDPYGINQQYLNWASIIGFIPGHSPRGMDIGQGKGRHTVIMETERRMYRYVEAPQPYFRGGIGIPYHDIIYHEWYSLEPINTGPTRRGVGGIVEPNFRPGISVFSFETVRRGTGNSYVRLERNPEEIIKIHRPHYNPNTFSLYSHNNWINLYYTDQVTSRYGVVWRGISRQRDRELGIGGGEIVVLDLLTNEILAVKRGFAYNNVRTIPSTSIGRTDWYGSDVCPKWDAGSDFNFVHAVLHPPLVQLKPPITK